METRKNRFFLGLGILLLGLGSLISRTINVSALGGGIGLPGYIVSIGALTSDAEQPEDGTEMPMLSGDGRLVAFLSSSADLEPGSGNPGSMYVHDRRSGQTTWVSVTESGEIPNGGVYSSTLSENGRYVVYASRATNVLIGQIDDADWHDIFVYDRLSGLIRLVTHIQGSSTTTANFYSSVGRHAISADGRRIVFWSGASDLTPGDTNGQQDIFVYDTVSDMLSRVLGTGGVQPTNGSVNAAISQNGGHIAFMSYANNLVPNDTGWTDIFVKDLEDGSLERVSVSATGTQASGDSDWPSISGDGRYVVFTSKANNLVTGDVNGFADIFVHDRQTGVTSIVSVGESGQQGNAHSTQPEISADGRYVLFSSRATTLVPGDTNNTEDVFLRDLHTNEITLLSVNAQALPHATGSAAFPFISANGRVFAYASNDPGITQDNNGIRPDVFVYAPPTVHYETDTFYGTEGDGTVPVTITLDAPWTVTATVAYSTSDGTATAPGDYTSVNGSLTFAPGETARAFSIPIVNDPTDEIPETIVLGLASQTPGILEVSPLPAMVLLQDNDGPTITLETSQTTILENNTVLHFTATLSTSSVETVTVRYTTISGTASPGSDYGETTGMLTFTPGTRSQSFSVMLLSDTQDESDETFTVRLEDALHGTLGTPTSTQIVIDDNDGPTISVEPVSPLLENDTLAVVTITLSTASPQTVSVNFESEAGSATPGSDYTAIKGSAIFPPGVTLQTLSIPVHEDTLDETDESFTLHLQNPTDGTLGSSPSAEILIVDDDGPVVTLVPLPMAVPEGNSVLVLTATLSAVSPQTVTVDIATVAGSALPGSDYRPGSATLSFAPGDLTEPFKIALIEDFLEEPDETFHVQISNPDNATIGTPGSVTITIADEDGVPMSAPVMAPPDPTTPVTVTLASEFGTIFITLTEVISNGQITATVRAGPLADPPFPYVYLPTYIDFESDGFAFSNAEIRMPYREVEATTLGVPEESLRLLQSAETVPVEWSDRTVALQVDTNTITAASESWGTFVVAQLPIPQCAITINNGATHTGTRIVRLFSQMEDAAEMLVGNDAGFPGSTWQGYTPNLTWTLTNPGPQITTLNVYMRLRDADGNALCSGLTLSDDIIYDPLPPQATIQSKRSGIFTFTLSATDQPNGSGVTDMQVGTHPDFLGVPWQPYTAIVTIDAPAGATIYARVRDGVGNRSAITSVVVPVSTPTPVGTATAAPPTTTVTPTGTIVPPTGTITPTAPPTMTPPSGVGKLYLPLVVRVFSAGQ